MTERVYAKLTDLVADPHNARVHDEANIRAIALSLAEHGQQHPIVVEQGTNRVLAGNGRLEAAKQLGWDTIWIVYSDLSGIEADRFALRDNRTGETSHWDYGVLREALTGLKDAGDGSSLGWATHDLMLAGSPSETWTPPSLETLPVVDTGNVSIRVNLDVVAAFEEAMALLSPPVSLAEAVVSICREWSESNL